MRSPWLMVLLASSLYSATPAIADGPDPELALRQAAKAYDRGNYKRVIAILGPLLSPQILLAQEAQVLQARKLLGISYVFSKNAPAAEREFVAILSERPDYRLDPLVDPQAAVEVFDSVKRRNAEKLRAILDRERREADRRRLDEARRRDRQRRQAELERQGGETVERTIVTRSYWVNFVPFGAGQFQNRQRGKGFTLLGTQAALGLTSLGAYLALRLAYPSGQVPAEEWTRARALNITQVVSGALFFATVAYGIIDALLHHQPRTVEEKRYRRAPRIVVGPQSLGLDLTF
ncbi:MAG: hypothetical protein IT371_32135 [Deltaproteobacteria bacterium]|nr:hypothetical protein [Deltaproteobacteria bacterium]